MIDSKCWACMKKESSVKECWREWRWDHCIRFRVLWECWRSFSETSTNKGVLILPNRLVIYQGPISQSKFSGNPEWEWKRKVSQKSSLWLRVNCWSRRLCEPKLWHLTFLNGCNSEWSNSAQSLWLNVEFVKPPLWNEPTSKCLTSLDLSNIWHHGCCCYVSW